MVTKVKIFGAGSIGNHLCHAARRKEWQVTLCDIDPEALRRAREEIYPARYGAWDESITLAVNDEASRGVFDWVFIGTPPTSHVSLAFAALDEQPKGILVEKPFATPDLAGCHELFERAHAAKVPIFVGYDHLASKALNKAVDLATNGIGLVSTIDVAFREHWQGIFDAHPWLEGPQDTYLGFWRKGGGALNEHSHALNMWQHLAHSVGAGRVVAVSATLDYFTQGAAEYDRLALLNLETETGLIGQVAQDVVTRPVVKYARVQGAEGSVEWRSSTPQREIVHSMQSGKTQEFEFNKTRADDFIYELDHLEQALANDRRSPLSIERGLESMLVIAAAHKSAQEKRRVQIDYALGFKPEALY